MNVVVIEPKGDKAAILVMDDGTRVWTPDRAKAQELVGKPIPADWTHKQGEYGPQAFPPREGKPGGGKPAWANTEEGERFVQERMDRRTAAMQAISAAYERGGWQELADAIYVWLRKNLDVSAPMPAAYAPAARDGADTPSDGGDGTEYPVGTKSGTVLPSPSSTKSHAEKWSPYGNPEKCAHQLVPGIKGWLKCTKCGRADKEAAWA